MYVCIVVYLRNVWHVQVEVLPLLELEVLLRHTYIKSI